MALVNVTAIIVTRGDVDLLPILASLPPTWERIVWDNGPPTTYVYEDANDWRPDGVPGDVRDCAVYGRYSATKYAKNEVIYVQDDDVIVSDPRVIYEAWRYRFLQGGDDNFVVCNMPPEFRHDFYVDHALVGFGAVFHRSLPWNTWGKLTAAFGDAGFPSDWAYEPSFLRTCDIPFTALNPRILVDVPKTDMPYANDETRMWKQPTHQAERARMLDLVKQIA